VQEQGHAIVPVHSLQPPHRLRRSRELRTTWLYLLAILNEFRWTIAALVLLILAGGILYRLTPHAQFGGARPDWFTAIYGAWMAMLAQPVVAPPQPWHLTLLAGFYPVLGFLLIGEGVVRLALLLMSKRHGEKEWMMVMASTCRDHVILCGLGHLGIRVFEQLLASSVDVVAIEIDAAGRFVAQAKATNAPVLIRDMKEDQSLIDAGVEHARAIIICTNDDMANVEVALDSRRLNPHIRVIMRLFDQQIARKISGALAIDAAFSASALAAPIVAAMSLQSKVLTSTMIAGAAHLIAEVKIEPASSLVGKRIDELEVGYCARVLSRAPTSGASQSSPSAATQIENGDVLTVYSAANQLPTIAAAAHGS
jgi:Trk K+ transport system NAD-binding subunit